MKNKETFNGDYLTTETVLKLKDKYDINIVLETGTYLGDTTEWFSENFNKVYTFEIDNGYRNVAKTKCGENTEFLGNSIKELPSILESINERCLFFLDAHWGTPCPTPYELEIISRYSKTKPIILIHDFYNPNFPNMQWDTYGDFAYKWENIEKYIKQIYPNDDYDCFYNDDRSKVGTIFIEPKNK
jgi:hypothetical protein